MGVKTYYGLVHRMCEVEGYDLEDFRKIARNVVPYISVMKAQYDEGNPDNLLHDYGEYFGVISGDLEIDKEIIGDHLNDWLTEEIETLEELLSMEDFNNGVMDKKTMRELIKELKWEYDGDYDDESSLLKDLSNNYINSGYGMYKVDISVREFAMKERIRFKILMDKTKRILNTPDEELVEKFHFTDEDIKCVYNKFVQFKEYRSAEHVFKEVRKTLQGNRQERAFLKYVVALGDAMSNGVGSVYWFDVVKNVKCCA